MTWEYIAGFFDGEGNINIQTRAGRRKCARLNISQNDRTVLEEICLFLKDRDIDARIYHLEPDANFRRPNIKWYIQIASAGSVKRFLEGVIEYLIVKRTLADEALALDYSIRRTKFSDKEMEEFRLFRSNGMTLSAIGRKMGRDNSFLSRLDRGLCGRR
ncbi:MAG: LAGLIDADG family homing endonuclease [Dehalococcoidia bacterium]|jgi:hypothetical protein